MRLIATLLLAWATTAQATFFPPRHGRSKTVVTAPSVSLANEALLERFSAHFAPVVSAKGGTLLLVPLWEDSRVNALASRRGDDWEIRVYGGLLASPELGEDEVMLVLCHELGHHLGGPPTASRGGWSSCEGQADYWAAAACAPVLSDPVGAARRLAQYYAVWSDGSAPEIGEGDSTRVSRTLYGYPNPQCRLDTMMAGFNGSKRPACWYAGD